MAADDSADEDVLGAIAEGMEKDRASFTSVLKPVLERKGISAITEIVAFLRMLVTKETPDNRDEIMEMSKEDMVIAIYRVNLFEKLRHPVVNDTQLEHLYQRTLDLWGEAPTEPIGRWAEWNLWVTRHRRRNKIAITEVIEGEKSVEDIHQQWIDRHQDREERRKLQKFANYEQYEAPEEVPSSLKHILVSPFITEDVAETVEVMKEEESEVEPELDVDRS